MSVAKYCSTDAETYQDLSTGILVFPPSTFQHPDMFKVYHINHYKRNVSRIRTNIYIPRPSGYYCGVSALGSKYVDYTIKRVPLSDILVKRATEAVQYDKASKVLTKPTTEYVQQDKTCEASGVQLCDVLTKSTTGYVQQDKTCEASGVQLCDVLTKPTTKYVQQGRNNKETETNYMYRIMTLDDKKDNGAISLHLYRNPITQKDEFTLTKQLIKGKPFLLEFKVFLRHGYIHNVIVQTLKKGYKYKRNYCKSKSLFSNHSEQICECSVCRVSKHSPRPIRKGINKNLTSNIIPYFDLTRIETYSDILQRKRIFSTFKSFSRPENEGNNKNLASEKSNIKLSDQHGLTSDVMCGVTFSENNMDLGSDGTVSVNISENNMDLSLDETVSVNLSTNNLDLGSDETVIVNISENKMDLVSDETVSVNTLKNNLDLGSDKTVSVNISKNNVDLGSDETVGVNILKNNVDLGSDMMSVDLSKNNINYFTVTRPMFDTPNSSRYWITQMIRRGLPMWRSIESTHIPLEHAQRMRSYDLDDFCYTSPCDVDITYNKLYSICREYQKINKVYNSRYKPGTLCFNGTPYDDKDSVPGEEDQLITINTRTVLPPHLGLAEGAKRSVMYDHAMHIVMTEQDTLWVGNLNYKPRVSPYRKFDWDETPLMRVEVEPGRYMWGAADVTTQMDHDDTVYFADKRGPHQSLKCTSCDVLEGCMMRAQLLNKYDTTPHVFMINKSKFNAKQNETVISRAELADRQLDRFVHLWACDEEEFEQYPRTPETQHKHNWWSQIDGYLHSFDLNIIWPTRNGIAKKVSLHKQRFCHASKLIVKNPETFFQRQLVSFEIVNGGRMGAAFTLVDAATFEVVGAVMVGLRGDSYFIHKKHEATRTRPAAGLYFTTKSYENTLESLERFVIHMDQEHGSHTNIKRDPRDIINYIGTACRHTTSSTPLAEFSDGKVTKECMFKHCYRPHDPYWYSRKLGTPRDKIVESATTTERYCVKRKLDFDEY